MLPELFESTLAGTRDSLGEQACVLRGYALPYLAQLLPALDAIQEAAPFRNMTTPGGYVMSVALTNCGALGWTTDRHGYRYTGRDPQSGRPWPAMPEVLSRLASEAAAEAGFSRFEPDACLINRYLPGSRLSLHQDKNEKDAAAPIVSVSLGIPAVFLFGGHERADRPRRVPLFHGDVAVWGGVDRMRYHGIMPLKEERHPVLGAQRINITLRKAG
ncbi:MAG: DNA oxidative demethylase AlkB [Pollutimonas bauzanensis]|uniref:DNA-N1-methyladenine dioxygenase n=1 Tax=Pollutimonas bauzanensis TaxID=658167 RepID=A0A1M5SNF9_9BURK|nr:DNA oxidative demethylase AlkB [Pollutimonas bauzanensis]SHH40067.1 DNA-N1-methyladenine dioxygenase [Pollutimonas bauzanensis]